MAGTVNGKLLSDVLDVVDPRLSTSQQDAAVGRVFAGDAHEAFEIAAGLLGGCLAGIRNQFGSAALDSVMTQLASGAMPLLRDGLE